MSCRHNRGLVDTTGVSWLAAGPRMGAIAVSHKNAYTFFSLAHA